MGFLVVICAWLNVIETRGVPKNFVGVGGGWGSRGRLADSHRSTARNSRALCITRVIYCALCMRGVVRLLLWRNPLIIKGCSRCSR